MASATFRRGCRIPASSEARIDGFNFSSATNTLSGAVEGVSFNLLAAGIVMGIMIVPYVTSLSEDAMRAVPMLLREGSYGMGAGKVATALRVVFPAALSGIGAAYTLAISRAVGETMIVALAAGSLAQMTLDPRQQVQTMTGYMVQIFLGDTAAGGVEYRSSYAVAAMLFLITMLITLLGYRVMTKFREVYE